MKTIACVALMVAVAVAGCGTDEPDHDPVDAGPPLFPWLCYEQHVCPYEGAMSDAYTTEYCFPERDALAAQPECVDPEATRFTYACAEGGESRCDVQCIREHTDRAFRRCD